MQQTHQTNPRECFTKTKIDFKLDLTMAGHSCHCLLSSFPGIGLSRDGTNHGLKSAEFKFFDNSVN